MLDGLAFLGDLLLELIRQALEHVLYLGEPLCLGFPLLLKLPLLDLHAELLKFNLEHFRGEELLLYLLLILFFVHFILLLLRQWTLVKGDASNHRRQRLRLAIAHQAPHAHEGLLFLEFDVNVHF